MAAAELAAREAQTLQMAVVQAAAKAKLARAEADLDTYQREHQPHY